MMWGTKMTNEIVVVTIQRQVKTARTKQNDQHLTQMIKNHSALRTRKQYNNKTK